MLCYTKTTSVFKKSCNHDCSKSRNFFQCKFDWTITFHWNTCVERQQPCCAAEVSPLEHVFKSANIRTNSSRYAGERERECVCVWEREREGEGGREGERDTSKVETSLKCGSVRHWTPWQRLSGSNRGWSVMTSLAQWHLLSITRQTNSMRQELDRWPVDT